LDFCETGDGSAVYLYVDDAKVFKSIKTKEDEKKLLVK